MKAKIFGILGLAVSLSAHGAALSQAPTAPVQELNRSLELPVPMRADQTQAQLECQSLGNAAVKISGLRDSGLSFDETRRRASLTTQDPTVRNALDWTIMEVYTNKARGDQLQTLVKNDCMAEFMQAPKFNYKLGGAK